MPDEDALGRLSKIRSELEQIRRRATPEMDLGELEEFMIGKLGVEFVAYGDGSEIIYRHEAFVAYNGLGNFKVHKIHPCHKKRIQMRRNDFRRFLYKRLNEIIDYLEEEAKRG